MMFALRINPAIRLLDRSVKREGEVVVCGVYQVGWDIWRGWLDASRIFFGFLFPDLADFDLRRRFGHFSGGKQFYIWKAGLWEE